MHLSDFDYELPKELIAQRPLEKGTAAGLWFSTEKKELLKTGRSTI